jgi:lipoic acid synthetase
MKLENDGRIPNMTEAGKSDSPKDLHIGKPKWLKTAIPTGKTYFAIKKDLRSRGLYTVCEEAKCPNIAECWASNTATFMVGGDTCTRACRFCNVKTGDPGGFVNPHEAEQVAESCGLMRLKYAVITMVDRDDLEDGGVSHVARVVSVVREKNPEIRIELLAGDFRGSSAAIEQLWQAGTAVYAHNLETVERLTPRVRDARASYRQSLDVLSAAKKIAPKGTFTKSALMLGLGETLEETRQTLKDMRSCGVDFVTIGQYMRPTRKHLSIKSFVTPEEFSELANFGKEIGFLGIASSPLVRSSYRAREFYEAALATL